MVNAWRIFPTRFFNSKGHPNIFFTFFPTHSPFNSALTVLFSCICFLFKTYTHLKWRLFELWRSIQEPYFKLCKPAIYPEMSHDRALIFFPLTDHDQSWTGEIFSLTVKWFQGPPITKVKRVKLVCSCLSFFTCALFYHLFDYLRFYFKCFQYV